MKQERLLSAIEEESGAQLAGAVHRVTFYNEENDYAVIRLRPIDDAVAPADAISNEGLITVTGIFPGVSEGLSLSCEGRWVLHPRYGRQFECKEHRAQLPGDINGTRVYLQQVKGIGPVSVERIIAHFGEERLPRILREEPERLLTLNNVKKEVLRNLVKYIRDNADSREGMEFLFSLGISPAIARRIHSTYGKETIARVRANPYMLAQEVYGIGFLRADKIAQQMGVPEQSPYRIRANLSHQLERATFDGNTYLPADQLCQRAVELLGVVDPKAVANELELSLQSSELREELFRRGSQAERAIYLPQYFEAERSSARRLRLLLSAESELRQKMSKEQWGAALNDASSRRDTPLTSEQLAAIAALHECKVSILTGGPGTGKTETLRTLIAILRECPSLKYALAAPTGRAAKRMEEATGSSASTIHRLLGFSFENGRWRPRHHEGNPFEEDIIVVDEASMLDLMLFSQLLKGIKPESHLLLLGDVDQLPSVGAGRVLRDCIESGKIAVTRLSQIFRQEADSAIISNAHLVVEGKMPMIGRRFRDFFLFHAREAEKAADLLVEVVCERIPREFPQYDALRDIQVMAPMHGGVAGVRNLNRLLQRRLNPPGRAELRIGENIFRIGDRLMQTKNNYDKEVYNGDIGFLKRVDTDTRQITVQFDRRQVEYSSDEVDQLTSAYCITIHKSQGSEYPVVVMSLLMQHFVMLQRNLLYTAITRAREKVIIVGNEQALARAAKNNIVEERYSGLLARLKGDYPARLGKGRAARQQGRRLSDLLTEEPRAKLKPEDIASDW